MEQPGLHARHRLAIAALVLMAGPAEADAADDFSVQVAKTFDAQGYAQVLAKVTNNGGETIAEARVDCDVYDTKLGAIGTAFNYIRRVAPHSNAIAEILVKNPPGPDPVDLRAECRITEAE